MSWSQISTRGPVIACHCLATVAVGRRESASLRWPLFMLVVSRRMLVVARDLIHPSKLVLRDGPRFDLYEQLAKEDGVDLLTASEVIRKGPKKVRVYMVGVAPVFSLTEFRVKSGDEVQIVLTNLDGVEDLSHGMCVSKHDVNLLVNPRDTRSITFTAGAPGVYWYYCPWFCHALHLEMRGRMIVEA